MYGFLLGIVFTLFWIGIIHYFKVEKERNFRKMECTLFEHEWNYEES